MIIKFLSLIFLLVNFEINNWIELFNGESLDGWEVKIRGYDFGENYRNTFRVEDGSIKVSYEGYRKFGDRFGHLFYTKKEFKNYILSLDYKFSGYHLKGAPGWSIKNSGVMLHCQDPRSMLKNQEFPVSAEAQLLGGVGAGERPTANICTPGTDVDINGKKADGHCINSISKTYEDEWVNVKLIVYSDSLIHHVIQSDTVLTYTNLRVGGDFIPTNYGIEIGEKLSQGYISLQSEGHPVEFKNIKILELL